MQAGCPWGRVPEPSFCVCELGSSAQRVGLLRGTAEIMCMECLRHGGHLPRRLLHPLHPWPTRHAEGRLQRPCSLSIRPGCWPSSPNGAALVAQFREPPEEPRASFLAWPSIPCVSLGADRWEDRLSGSPSCSSIFSFSESGWPGGGSSFLLIMGWHLPFLWGGCPPRSDPTAHSLAVPSRCLAPPAPGSLCPLAWVCGHKWLTGTGPTSNHCSCFPGSVFWCLPCFCIMTGASISETWKKGMTKWPGTWWARPWAL